MARASYFSGDLAALNDAAAADERNRIAGRQANQMFLANLVGESTRRRGQDVEERMGRQRNETLMGMEGLRVGSMDRSTDAQLQAARLMNAREMVRISNDMERINQAEREGLRVDVREKARLEQAAKDAEANRNQLLAVTLIQALSQRQDPRLAVAQFETSAALADQDDKARAAASMLDLFAKQDEGMFGTPGADEYANAMMRLSPEQQQLVTTTNTASGMRAVPRLRLPPQGLGGNMPAPPAGQQNAAPSRVPIPIEQIFRGTNLPAGTGSPLMTNIAPRAGQPIDLATILQILSQQR